MPSDIAALRVKADTGDANAQWLLGYYYYTGQGVPKDDAETALWFRLAADQGYADAQANLGFMYGTGRGVPQDDAQAMSWFRKAAEQGHTIAQLNLGAMCFTGRGVPQDYVESHKWSNLAASRASAENQTRYAEVRDAVAKVMTPAQVAEAQTLAREWHAAFDGRQSWEGVGHLLFERLLAVRLETARERAVPPYIIFHDAALREMVRLRPTSLDAFRSVKGVGARKADDLGERFLSAIRDYR
jgi:superfamily II DNA helicase RecQ|tara:strand:- start:1580 stop:2308 length:729 start_codon:yes stop_codon:yes gene_type:complete